MGITTPLASDMTIALGSNGVKLYDMVVSYGAFANGGFRVRPYCVERVENSRGVTIYENSGPKIVKVISFETAAGMTYMLRKVVEVGTGKAANFAPNVAGKTGTTNDYRDAWFVGYTPDIVTGVWVGNDNNSKLPGITGGAMPARVFTDYMKTATQNFPKSVFDYPSVGGGSSTYLNIDDVVETVDESEERAADKKVLEESKKAPKNIEVQIQTKQNQIDQVKPSKPQKQFEENRDDLIEYDDEKPIETSVPLPGM
jgi:penicillin-binding protein 1A